MKRFLAAVLCLQAVPGQLTIVGSATARVTLSGPLNWTGHSPVATIGFAAGHTLRLSYRCAAASPCTADWRLTVPWATFFSKGVTVGFGRTHDRRYTAHLRDLVLRGRARSRRVPPEDRRWL